jgi:hypothetical protein
MIDPPPERDDADGLWLVEPVEQMGRAGAEAPAPRFPSSG